MTLEELKQALEAYCESYRNESGDRVDRYADELLALVMPVIEAADEYDREFRNPAPDYTMRKHRREAISTTLRELKERVCGK